MTLSEAIKVGDAGHPALHIEERRAVNDFGEFARNHGVKADGVTNDSAALQAAINAANGRRVVLPAGQIVLTTPVQIDTAHKVSEIVGAGVNTTILKPATTALTIDTTGSGDAGLSWIKIRDLQVQGGTSGLRAVGDKVLTHFALERVLLYENAVAGLKTECEILSSTFREVQTHGTILDSMQYGLWFGGKVAHNHLGFYDCVFRGATIAGLLLGSENDAQGIERGGNSVIHLANTALESNYGAGAILRRIFNAHFDNLYLENNNRSDLNYPDVWVQQIGINASAPQAYAGNLTFTNVGGSYNLSMPQPQVFLRADAGAGVIEVTNSRLIGYHITPNGATVYLRNTDLINDDEL